MPEIVLERPYYIHEFNEKDNLVRFTEVDGTGFVVDGLEGFDFFFHLKPGSPDEWRVSEGKSGCRVADFSGPEGAPVHVLAIVSVAQLITDPHKFADAITEAIKKHGISPRYQTD